MPKVTESKAPVKVVPKKRKTGGDVLDRIEPMEIQETGVKVLGYGESGTGKTTFGGTFPGPILWMICSGGVGTGELRSLNTPELRKKIKQVRIEKSIDVMTLALHYRDLPDFNTIILDHATGLQHLVLAETLGLSQDQLPTQLSWGTATQEQWSIVAMQMKETLRSLLNMVRQHVFIIAQQREFEATKDGDSIAMPNIGAAVSPSVLGWLNPACDYIVQTFKRANMDEVEIDLGAAGGKIKQMVPGKGVQYVLRTAPHATFTTKFRVPKGQYLPDDVTDPDFNKLMKVINGTYK